MTKRQRIALGMQVRPAIEWPRSLFCVQRQGNRIGRFIEIRRGVIRRERRQRPHRKNMAFAGLDEHIHVAIGSPGTAAMLLKSHATKWKPRPHIRTKRERILPTEIGLLDHGMRSQRVEEIRPDKAVHA